MTRTPEEVTLRELYLIARRGLPVILAVTLAVAVIAYGVSRLGAPSYQARAVVQVTPLQLNRVVSDAVDLSGVATVTFDAYRAVAFGTDVLAATRSALEGDSVPTAGLREHLTLERITTTTSGPLVVAQQASARTAAASAAISNAWAAATADALRSAVAGSLDDLSSTLTRQEDALGKRLDQAEAAWTEFLATDDRDALSAQLTALEERRTAAQQRVDFLHRLEAASVGRQRVLSGIVGARGGSGSADVDGQLRALSAQGVLPEDLAGALQQALAASPPAGVPADQDLATLVARVELQNDVADLAAYEAELGTIATELDGLDARASDLRRRSATLEGRSASLSRDLASAQAAYQQVAGLTPGLGVAQDLAANGARVMLQASPPAQAQPRRSLALSAVAALIAFLGATVFVFLRAAVAEPAAREAS